MNKEGEARIGGGSQDWRRKPGLEEMLEVPPEWNEVPALMMEEEDVLPKATGSTKRRRDEISRGLRKLKKEYNI